MYRKLNGGAAASKISSLVIDKFLGVDFSSKVTEVDAAHSPDACNIICNELYKPEKRYGYKSVFSGSGMICGIYRFNKELLVHCGKELFSVTKNKTLFSGMYENKSTFFEMNETLYILDSVNYLCYDGTAVDHVYNKAFVPTTVIGRSAAGGGTAFEPVNLLTGKRCNGFIADGYSDTYNLDTKNIDSVEACYVNGVSVAFNAHLGLGAITFHNIPAVSPSGEGVTNVFIYFTKNLPVNRAKITGCTIAGLYGGENDTRVFLAGNYSMKNTDFASGLYDPTYFPDTGYTKIGGNSKIKGYVNHYDTQIIIKEGSANESTLFLRKFNITSDGTVFFTVSQGAAGVGCLAEKSMTNLDGEPVFLSKDGLRAVVGTDVDDARILAQRSEYIDAKLLKESDLSDAVCAVYQNKYFLFVNGNVYIADPRVRSSARSYEFYFFDNFPATAAYADFDGLWFGRNGKVYKYCTEEEENKYLDDGSCFSCHYTTPILNFGRWDRLKTVRSVFVTALPYRKSSFDLYLLTEEQEAKYIDGRKLDFFDFNDFDFSRVNFAATATPVAFRIKCRQKRFQHLQVKISNGRDDYEEGFGFDSLRINYSFSGRVKH